MKSFLIVRWGKYLEILLAIIAVVVLYWILGMINPISRCDLRHASIMANVDEDGNVINFKYVDVKERILKKFYREKSLNSIVEKHKLGFEVNRIFFFNRDGIMCFWDSKLNKSFTMPADSVPVLFKLASVKISDVYNYIAYLRLKIRAQQGLIEKEE